LTSAGPAPPSGHWRLPCDPASVSRARSAAHSFLADSHRSGNEDVALLLISELMSNAVVHAQGLRPIDLRLEVRAERLHIEVEDGDPTPPVRRDVRLGDDRGRGLLIVDRMADEWGWSPARAGGKRVWCEVRALPG
jgi:anti-sigma regulatory factor (Ser/Thr protein kinase)